MHPCTRDEAGFSEFKPFEYICVDAAGPLPVESIKYTHQATRETLGGNVYVFAFMCMATRWVRLYYAKERTQDVVYQLFHEFFYWVRSSRILIKNIGVTSKLLSDLGGEFTNKMIRSFCENWQIKHSFSATTCHHQNAHVERLFRTLWAMMNKLLFQGDVPWELWEFVLTHAVYCRNRMAYFISGQWVTPHFLVHGHECKHTNRVKIFYSQCWSVVDTIRTKFDVNSEELRWCGLAENIKGVICYRPSDGNVFVAGNVKTIENPNEYGKLLNMTVTAYDLQDSVEYKKLINFPEYIQTEPTVKRFDRIIKHQVQFSEDDEQSYAICLILTENQSTPFWIRLFATI